MIAPLILSIGALGLAPQSDPSQYPLETTPETEIPAITPVHTALFDVELKAGAWIPRLKGDVTLGNNASINIEEQLDGDDLEHIFRGELTIQPSANWMMRFHGFDFSTSEDGTMVGFGQFGSLSLIDGDAIHVESNLTSYGAELGFGVFDTDVEDSSDPQATGLHFDGIVGARYIDVDQSVESAFGRDSGEGEWIGLYAGLEMHARISGDEGLPLGKGLDLTSSILAGPALGADGGFIWEIRSDITLWITEQFSIMFGYRLLELDVEDDDYTFDAGLQGLIVGGAIRF